MYMYCYIVVDEGIGSSVTNSAATSKAPSHVGAHHVSSATVIDQLRRRIASEGEMRDEVDLNSSGNSSGNVASDKWSRPPVEQAWRTPAASIDHRHDTTDHRHDSTDVTDHRPGKIPRTSRTI
jgi:hypothetical protein